MALFDVHIRIPDTGAAHREGGALTTAEWATCSRCALKHRPRPDGQCPRCRALIGAGAAAADSDEPPPLPVAQAAPPAPAVPDARALPDPRRIPAAGALLIGNGLVRVLERLVLPALTAGFTVVPILVDLVVGGLLLTRNPWVIKVAKGRALLGGIAFAAMLLFTGRHYVAVVQLLFSLCLLGLLYERMRLRNAAAGAGLCFLLQIAWLGAVLPEERRLARSRAESNEFASSPLSEEIQGDQIPYRLRLSEGWRPRQDLVRRESRRTDLCFVHPKFNAHVLVLARLAPADMGFPQLFETYVEQAQRADPAYTALERYDLEPSDSSRMLHVQYKAAVRREEGYTGLFLRPPHVFQVIVYTTSSNFPLLQEQLRAIVASFEMP
jgi:hypothetical protein